MLELFAFLLFLKQLQNDRLNLVFAATSRYRDATFPVHRSHCPPGWNKCPSADEQTKHAVLPHGRLGLGAWQHDGEHYKRFAASSNSRLNELN